MRSRKCFHMWVKCQSSHIYKINSVIIKRVKCQSSHIYKINSVIIKNAIILNIIHDISNLWDTYTYEYYHLKDINDNTPYFKASIYNASILENATSGKIINIMIVIYPFFFLVIVLFIIQRFTASGYPFGIFTLFLKTMQD
jgi:hypothetical protein